MYMYMCMYVDHRTMMYARHCMYVCTICMVRVHMVRVYMCIYSYMYTVCVHLEVGVALLPSKG